MSVYNNIRAALEVTLSQIPDVPPIQYNNTRYQPTTGQPFITSNFLPTSRRPAELGTLPFNLYQGLFVVNVYTPDNTGPTQNQNICNSILTAFPAGTHSLEFNDQIVRIEYTEMLGSFKDSPWFITPVNVGWYAYDKS